MRLTEAEKHIIELLRKGLSNERISEDRNISINTVKYHLKNIYIKLEASNRVEAVVKSNSLFNESL